MENTELKSVKAESDSDAAIFMPKFAPSAFCVLQNHKARGLSLSMLQNNEYNASLQNTPQIRMLTGVIGHATLTLRGVESSETSHRIASIPKIVLGLLAFVFSPSASNPNSTQGVETSQEAYPHERQAHNPRPVEACRPHEQSGRADTRSEVAASHEKAESPIHEQLQAIQSDSGLLVRSSQTNPQAEAAEVMLSLSGWFKHLAIQGQVRPLVVHKSYWADIAPEKDAEWYQPIYFWEAA